MRSRRCPATRSTSPATTGSITVDGDLSDEGWRNATRVDKWYETHPGDNIEPKVRNVGYLTYDDHFFYAGVRVRRSESEGASARRLPTATTSATASTTTAASSSTRATPAGPPPSSSSRRATSSTTRSPTTRRARIRRRISSGSRRRRSPNTAGRSRCGSRSRRCATRTSIRRPGASCCTATIPRDRHYQFFSAKLPRGGNCFVCRSNTLDRAGAAAGRRTPRRRAVRQRERRRAPARRRRRRAARRRRREAARRPRRQVHAERRQRDRPHRQAGLLAGRVRHRADLGERALRAVLSREAPVLSRGRRSVPDADSGGLHADDHRAGRGAAACTGKGSRHPLHRARRGRCRRRQRDHSGPERIDAGVARTTARRSSSARVKRDIGLSFVGVLATDREARSGDSHNRVVGPDFQWRPSGTDVVTGPVARTARRARRTVRISPTSGPGSRSPRTRPAPVEPQHDASRCLRACTRTSATASAPTPASCRRSAIARRTAAADGRSGRPASCTRLRTFVNLDRQVDRSGALISRDVEPGVGLDTRWNGFMQFRFIDENIRAGEQPIGRKRFGFIAQFSPSRVVTQLSIDGTTGQEIDFANARPGTGSTINLQATLNPTNHLNLDLVQNQRWVNVDDPVDVSQRLFIARVSRLRGTYTFTARLFARGIVAVRVDDSRRQPLHRSRHDRARRHAERAGAAVVQAELAVGHVRRLRRRSRSGGPESTGQVGASGVREAVVRVSALRDHETRRETHEPRGTKHTNRGTTHTKRKHEARENSSSTVQMLQSRGPIDFDLYITYKIVSMARRRGTRRRRTRKPARPASRRMASWDRAALIASLSAVTGLDDHPRKKR